MSRIAPCVLLVFTTIAASQVIDPATYWPPVLLPQPSSAVTPYAEEFTISAKGYVQARAVASDGYGNIYVAGTGNATGVPGLERGFQPKNDGQDALIIKLGPSGNVLWSTWLGGTDERGIDGYEGEYADDVAADATGVYVTGRAVGRNFPILNAFRPTGGQFFVAKFSPDGKLLYSSYLEGNGSRIVVGPAGDAWILIGNFRSFQPTHDLSRGRSGPYVLKLNPAGHPVWTTKVGVPFVRSFGVDSAARSYVAGSTNCFVASSLRPCEFVAVQLDTSGAHLGYETYVVDQRARDVLATVTSNGRVVYHGLSCATTLPPRRSADVRLPDCDSGPANRWVVTLDATGAVDSVKYVDADIGAASFATTDIYDRTIRVSNAPPGDAYTRRALVDHHVDGPVYVSEDHGTTWTAGRGVTADVSEFVSNQVIDLDFDPARKSVYATTVASVGLYESTDNGHTWQLDRRATAPLWQGRFVRVFTSLALDRFDPAIRYSTIGGDVMRHDRNSDWEMVLAGSGISSFEPSWSVLEASPHDGSIWTVARGRLAVSRDRGASWTQKLLPASIGRIAFDAARPSRMYGAGAGLFVSDDNGDSWGTVRLGLPLVPTVTAVASHANGNVIYLATQTFSAPTGLMRSTDAGQTWVMKLSGHDITAVAADPARPYVYAAGIDRTARTVLYRSRDYGETWQVLRRGLDVRGRITRLLIDPRDSARIYLGAQVNAVPYIARIGVSPAANAPMVDFASYLGHGTARAITTSPTGEIIIALDLAATRYSGEDRISVVVIDDERRRNLPLVPRRPQ